MVYAYGQSLAKTIAQSGSGGSANNSNDDTDQFHRNGTLIAQNKKVQFEGVCWEQRICLFIRAILNLLHFFASFLQNKHIIQKVKDITKKFLKISKEEEKWLFSTKTFSLIVYSFIEYIWAFWIESNLIIDPIKNYILPPLAFSGITGKVKIDRDGMRQPIYMLSKRTSNRPNKTAGQQSKSNLTQYNFSLTPLLQLEVTDNLGMVCPGRTQTDKKKQ